MSANRFLDSLKIITITADKLKPLPGNPRKVKDADAMRKLQDLIRVHGFRNPLEVAENADGTFTILAGNHRFQAARDLGITEFPCSVYEGSSALQIARAISDNKSSEWTDWDVPGLKEFMAGIADEDIDVEATGFTDDELNAIFADPPEFQPVREDDQSRLDEKAPITCPECGHQWQT